MRLLYKHRCQLSSFKFLYTRSHWINRDLNALAIGLWPPPIQLLDFLMTISLKNLKK